MGDPTRTVNISHSTCECKVHYEIEPWGITGFVNETKGYRQVSVCIEALMTNCSVWIDFGTLGIYCTVDTFSVPQNSIVLKTYPVEGTYIKMTLHNADPLTTLSVTLTIYMST